MKNLVKIVLFLVIFSVFTVYSFGETFFGMSGGYYRLHELYPEEDYGRDLEGAAFIISLNHYPEATPLGWFFRTSIGGIVTGIEWYENEFEPIRIMGSTDIQISTGPSMKLNLGSIIHIPISLGPAFTFYREDNYIWNESRGQWGYYNESERGFLRAYNLGLLADASILINPYKWLSINAFGLNVSWDFLHWESGFTEGKFRSINHGRDKLQNYHGVKLGFYFGAGFRFDNPNGGRKVVNTAENTVNIITITEE